MKFLSFLLFTLFLIKSMHSQELTVIDKLNEKGIENVFIFSNKESVWTDHYGNADISHFSDKDTLYFQHSSYKTKKIAINALKELNYIIKLSESIIDVDEIVVSANSWEQHKNEIPNQISTITSKELKYINPQTSADLIAHANGVFVQKSQMGGGSPMIRGFASNRVLIVIDGVRLNNAIYRSGNLQNIISIDANSIQNAEVIQGPGSVIYGSDAIGGVIDFHSITPEFSDSSLFFKANFKGRYSTANNEKTGHLHFSLNSKKISLLSSISFSDYSDLKMGSFHHNEYTRREYATEIAGKDTVVSNDDINLQKFTAYSQLNFMQKISYKPSKKLKVRYGLYYSRLSDVPRYDRLIQYSNATLKYANWYYGPQKWLMQNLLFKYKTNNILFNNAKIVVAHQKYKESRHDRKFNNSQLRSRYEEVDILSMNIDFEKEVNSNHALYYGIELSHNLIHSKGVEKNILDGSERQYASRYPDGSRYLSLSAYLNHKLKVNKNLFINSGLRYNYVEANADFDTAFFKFPFKKTVIKNRAFNGSLGFVYNSSSKWLIKSNFSTGFRAPNIDDIGKIFDSEPGNVIVPNNNLEPEYALNTDFGIAKAFNSKIQVEALIFRTWLFNALSRTNFKFNGQDSIYYDGELSNVQAITNTSMAKVYGLQIALKAEIYNNIFIKSELTYTKGKEKDAITDNFVPLRHVAPIFGSTTLTYKSKKLHLRLNSTYNGMISNKNLAPSEKAKKHIYSLDKNGQPYCPAWYTINANVTLLISKAFQLNLAVENILDVRYRPYSSGIVSAGRNIILSLNYNI